MPITRAYLDKMEERIMATQKEVAARLDKVNDRLGKIGNESATMLKTIEELRAAVEAQGNASPEVLAALEKVETQAGVVDDLVPDATETPPTEPTNPPEPS